MRLAIDGYSAFHADAHAAERPTGLTKNRTMEAGHSRAGQGRGNERAGGDGQRLTVEAEVDGGGKSEIRRPKSERIPKSGIRIIG